MSFHSSDFAHHVLAAIERALGRKIRPDDFEGSDDMLPDTTPFWSHARSVFDFEVLPSIERQHFQARSEPATRPAGASPTVIVMNSTAGTEADGHFASAAIAELYEAHCFGPGNSWGYMPLDEALQENPGLMDQAPIEPTLHGLAQNHFSSDELDALFPDGWDSPVGTQQVTECPWCLAGAKPGEPIYAADAYGMDQALDVRQPLRPAALAPV